MNIHKLWNTLYQQEADGDAGSPPEGDAGGDEGGDTGGQESLLDGSSPELADGEWFQSDGIKGTGETPDWYQPDHFKNVNEQAKGYAELQKKFGSFVGTPKDGFKLPEGVEKDDALAVEFIKLSTDMNMSQDGFDKVFELLSTQLGVSEEVSSENEMAKLGDNAQQRIKTVENALKHKFGDDYSSVQDLVYSADGVMLAEAIIKKFAPARLPVDGGENPTGVTKSEIELLMQEKNADGQLRRSVDRDFDKMITRKWTELLGSGPDVVTLG